MKSIRILTLACLAALALPTDTFAAKGVKGDKANKPGKIVRQYDSNGDGKIDGDEVAPVRKAFESDKNGPLKQFDTDSDGKLSDSEVAAMKGRAKGEKKKNKNA
jgi:Ca2+-binding EF-hand superfamily protein